MMSEVLMLIMSDFFKRNAVKVQLKKAVCLTGTVLLLLSLTACSWAETPANSQPETDVINPPSDTLGYSAYEEMDAVSSATLNIKTMPTVDTQGNSNVLVVYFSTNDTIRAVALTAADVLRADVFEIVPVDPYSEEDLNYHKPGNRAGQEQWSGTRPAIVSLPDDLSQYDTILLGYPIWGGQAPNILYTFLESTTLHDATILPFCTSNVVGPGTSAANMEALTDESVTWLPAQRIPNNSTEDDLYRWAESLIPYMTAEQNEEIVMNQTMSLTIEDVLVSVAWEDNESVDALREIAKNERLTINMSMYGGFEQVGAIGQTLPRNDTQTTTQSGDIVLYSGNQIVVFYGSNSWAYTRLGRITDKSAEEMKELLGNGDVTITLSLSAE